MTKKTKTRNEKALTLARSTATRLVSALETYKENFPKKALGEYQKAAKKLLRPDNAPKQCLIDLCTLHYDDHGPAQKLSSQAIVSRLLQFHDVAGTIQSIDDPSERKLPWKSFIKLADLASSLVDGSIQSWSGFQYLIQPMLLAEALQTETIDNETIYKLYMSKASAIDDWISEYADSDQTVAVGQKENRRVIPVAMALRESLRTNGVAPSTATTQRPTSMHLLHWFEFGVNDGNRKVVTFDRQHPMFRAILALLSREPVTFE